MAPDLWQGSKLDVRREGADEAGTQITMEIALHLLQPIAMPSQNEPVKMVLFEESQQHLSDSLVMLVCLVLDSPFDLALIPAPPGSGLHFPRHRLQQRRP